MGPYAPLMDATREQPRDGFQAVGRAIRVIGLLTPRAGKMHARRGEITGGSNAPQCPAGVRRKQLLFRSYLCSEGLHRDLAVVDHKRISREHDIRLCSVREPHDVGDVVSEVQRVDGEFVSPSPEETRTPSKNPRIASLPFTDPSARIRIESSV